jgi:hypothetical protein
LGRTGKERIKEIKRDNKRNKYKIEELKKK